MQQHSVEYGNGSDQFCDLKSGQKLRGVFVSLTNRFTPLNEEKKNKIEKSDFNLMLLTKIKNRNFFPKRVLNYHAHLTVKVVNNSTVLNKNWAADKSLSMGSRIDLQYLVNLSTMPTLTV